MRPTCRDRAGRARERVDECEAPALYQSDTLFIDGRHAMARSLDPEAHRGKRNEILDAAERLFYSKGYAAMTVQDLLDEVGLSNGAFFHYFASKAAVLEGFIDRLREDSQGRLQALVD